MAVDSRLIGCYSVLRSRRVARREHDEIHARLVQALTLGVKSPKMIEFAG
jgi:hypothetical protein